MEALLLLAGLGVVVWFGKQVASGYSRASMDEAEAARRGREHRRLVTEKRAVELMFEFPSLGDEDIATLLRDELVQSGNASPEWLYWASEETVARMRREILVAAVRSERKKNSSV